MPDPALGEVRPQAGRRPVQAGSDQEKGLKDKKVQF